MMTTSEKVGSNIREANAEAIRRILEAEPVLIDVVPASEAIPALRSTGETCAGQCEERSLALQSLRVGPQTLPRQNDWLSLGRFVLIQTMIMVRSAL